MSTERELKTIQEDRLFDIYMLQLSDDEGKKRRLAEMEEKAKSGMSREEIAEVRERARTAYERSYN